MPRQTVEPGWPGERFAPGGVATFRDRAGRQVTGKVVELRKNHAIVAGGGNGRWRVGYRRLWAEEPVSETAIDPTGKGPDDRKARKVGR